MAIINDNPRRLPEICFNYMVTDIDLQDMRVGGRITCKIFAQVAFDPFRGHELAPGLEVTSDDEIDAFVRAHGESCYRQSCTCKVGPASDGRRSSMALARSMALPGFE